MPVTLILHPVKDRNLRDLSDAIGKIVTGEWILKGLTPNYWILLRFYDRGVVDHELRENAGHEGGKASLPWYRRDHEILGIGPNPATAARDILSGGRGARLRARQICDSRGTKHLIFSSLDTGEIFLPKTAQKTGEKKQ